MATEEISAQQLKTLVDDGLYVDAADLVSYMEPEKIHSLLTHLDNDTAADIFCELPDTVQRDVVSYFNRDELTTLLETLMPDDRADLAKSIPEEQLDAVLPFLAKKERDEIKTLSSYKEGTAGSVMTTEYVAFPAAITVQQAINRIRLEGAEKEAIWVIFVLDAQHKLSGYTALEDLILAKPAATLAELQKQPIATVTPETDQEEAARVISKYGLLMLPVVDSNGMLVGVITHDDAMDVIKDEQTEDMERLMAISGHHDDTSYIRTSAFRQFVRRAPWLIILALLDFISGAVLKTYQDTIATLMLLTFYMPMLIDMGGNTGSQSATVIVRALALREISAKDFFKVVWKELRISLMLGLVLGAVVFVRVMLSTSGADIPAYLTIPQIGFVIALALAAQVVSATIIGAALPLLSSAFKLDPALIASPALTTIVDITGLLIYFGLAKLMLGL